MPTYLYVCPDPNHGEFEEFHSIKEKLEECPLCKAEGKDPPCKVIRLISKGTGFILLGSCWAKDSYSG